MKKVIITCDKCKSDLSNSNSNKLIELGSENEQEFFFRNTLNDAKVMNIERYRNLHFCSKDCFIGYFFEF